MFTFFTLLTVALPAIKNKHQQSRSMTIQVDFQPVGRKVTIEKGVSILDASRAAGVGLSAVCGGESSCGSCQVRLSADAAVSPPNSMETNHLSPNELEKGVRLACQTFIQGNLRVEIPPESLTAPQRTQIEGEEFPFELQPPVKAYTLALKGASREDQRSDWERVSEALQTVESVHPKRIPLSMVKKLPAVLRENNWQVQVGLREDCVVCVSAPETPLLGLSVDIGTTKVAVYLIDMKTGNTLASQGAMNPQIAYGEDIMARLSYLMKHPTGDNDLQKSIVETLNKLATGLCHQAAAQRGGETALQDLNPRQIVEVVIVGNTAMHHLFLGLPCSQLGTAPYIAASSAAMDVYASELGLLFSAGAVVHLLPNIAGFVGGDHVSMLLAADVNLEPGNCIYIDIGTNTEITLTTNRRKRSCSTASGPAFEGAHIKDGMRAADGAIERVRIVSGRIEVQTVNHKKAVGICGSGILDAIAQFKLSGLMNKSGAFAKDHPLFREGPQGGHVVLAAGEQTEHGRDIILTRKDISEIQLAKGAIRAGIEILLLEAALSADQLDRFVIAGAFGSFIDTRSAMTIGMFPTLPGERFRQIGNAAGIGAKLALLSTTKRMDALGIAKTTEYVELSNHAAFTDQFAKAMTF